MIKGEVTKANGFQGFQCWTKGFNPLSDQGRGQLVLPKTSERRRWRAEAYDFRMEESCWCSASFKTSRLDSSNYPNVFWAVGRLHGASELQSKTSQRDWCPLWPHSTGTLQSADHYVVGWNDSWRRRLRLPLCQIPWQFNGFQGSKCCTKGFNPLSDQGQGQLVLPKNTRGNPMTCRRLMSSLDDLTSAWKYQIPVPCRVEKMPKFCCSHQTSPKTCTFVRKTIGLRRWVGKSDLQPWSNLRMFWVLEEQNLM